MKQTLIAIAVASLISSLAVAADITYDGDEAKLYYLPKYLRDVAGDLGLINAHLKKNISPHHEGAADNAEYPSGNNVTINYTPDSDPAKDPTNVAGGMADTGLVEGNTVDLINGTVTWRLSGGITVSGEVKGNTVNINGGSSAFNYGGLSQSGAVTDNIVNLTAGISRNNFGGSSRSGKVENNSLTLSGAAKAENLYGGQSSGLVTKNKVLVSAGEAESVIGGANRDSHPSSGDITANTVTISGGKISQNVVGGQAGYDSTASSANVSNNSVSISAGKIGWTVYGGRLRGSANTGEVKQNKVSITGNTVPLSIVGDIIGGYGTSNVIENQVILANSQLVTTAGKKIIGGQSDKENAQAKANKVTISAGKINSLVYGGYTEQNNNQATENQVTVNGGTMGGAIYGGYAEGDNSPVTNNQVTISGGIINNTVYGGYAVRNNSPVTNNQVTISGGTINGVVYGGMNGSSGIANDNLISLSGTPNLTNARLYGGSNHNSSGNTLEVKSKIGAVKEIYDFANYFFYLPADIKPNETMLSVTERKVDLGNKTVAVKEVPTLTALLDGQSINLIHAEQGFINPATVKLEDVTVGGLIKASGKIALGGGINSNKILFTLGDTPPAATIAYNGDATKLYYLPKYLQDVEGDLGLIGSKQKKNISPHQDGAADNAEYLSGNKVTIDYASDPAKDPANVAGGMADTGLVEGNTVDLIKGTVTGKLSGGITVSGEVKGNTVNINGGSSKDNYGGHSKSGKVEGNSITLSETAEVGSLYGGQSSGLVTKNKVVVSGGLAQQAIGGINWSGQPSSGDITANTVTISGGKIANQVIGGEADYYGAASSRNVSNNSVSISAGEIGGKVYGGRLLGSANTGEVTQNTVSTSGIIPLNLTQDIIGGYGTSDVIANEVNLTNSQLVTTAGAKIIGGQSDKENAKITANKVTISAETINGKVYGGYTVKNNNQVTKNQVAISAGAINGYVYGGYTYGGSGSAVDNQVNIDGGTFAGDIYGGYTYGGSGSAVDNQVNIDGGTFAGYIYGGYTDGDNSPVTKNQVTISGGTINNDVHGGYASKNSSAVTKNQVTISGGVINRNVYGGVNMNGGITNDNLISLTGTANLTNASLYGGVNPSSTGNTLEVKSKIGAVKRIENFANYFFYLPADIKPNETMLSVTEQKVDLGNKTVAVKEVPTLTALLDGQSINLIHAEKGFDNPTTVKLEDVTVGGLIKATGVIALGVGSNNDKMQFTLGTLTPLLPPAATITYNGDATELYFLPEYLQDVASDLGLTYANQKKNISPHHDAAVANAEYLSDNKVTIDYATGQVEKNPVNVAGGMAKEKLVENNTVNLINGTVTGKLSGGITVSGEVKGNQVNISGGQSANSYGGLSHLGAVTDNKLNLTVGSSDQNFGGYSNSGKVEANSITLSGSAKAGYLIGGQSSGLVTKNKVLVSAGEAKNVIGGVNEYDKPSSGDITANTVTISGGKISQDVVGGKAGYYSTASSANVSNNSVSINAGEIGRSIYGGYLYGSANTGVVKQNKVSITGTAPLSIAKQIVGGDGTSDVIANEVSLANSQLETAAGEEIVGGRSNKENTKAMANKVTISAGTINSRVYGGYTVQNKSQATENQVTVNGGTIGGAIYGGYAEGDNSPVTNNQVTISGGIINSTVRGGYAIRNNSPVTNNQVTISGGTINGVVYGGMNGSSGIANDNLISLSGTPNLTNARLYGGSNHNSSGNTLEVKSKIGAVKEIYDFANYFFYLPADIKPNETMLSVTERKVDLGNKTVAVKEVPTLTALLDGQSINLIHAEQGFINPATVKLEDVTVGGLISATGVIALGEGTDNDKMQFTLGAPTPDPDPTPGPTPGPDPDPTPGPDPDPTPGPDPDPTPGPDPDPTPGPDPDPTPGPDPDPTLQLKDGAKLVAEGHLAGTILVQESSELILNRLTEISKISGEEVVGFADIAAGRNRYNTGSHVKANNVVLNVGATKAVELERGRLTYGAYFKAGNGDYDAQVTEAGKDYKASGKTNNYGLAGLMQWQLNPNLSLSATLGVGKVSTDFNSPDLTYGGKAIEYKSKTSYVDGSLGVNYFTAISEVLTADVSSNYLWLRQGSDSVKSNSDMPLHFASRTGQRWLNKVKLSYAARDDLNLYSSLGFNYSFNGKAMTRVYTLDVEAPSLKGGSGLLDVGFNYRPNASWNIGSDVAASFGKRRGFQFNFNAKYKFK